MRLFSSILCASFLVACTSDSSNTIVDARDACFEAAKSVDDVALTTSALRVETKRGLQNMMTFNWPAEQHGKNYVCVVNASARKITNFTMNGMPVLLDGIPKKLRTF